MARSAVASIVIVPHSSWPGFSRLVLGCPGHPRLRRNIKTWVPGTRVAHGPDRRGRTWMPSMTKSMVQEILPPQTAAMGGFGFAVIGQDRAVERAVERGQHAALDEIEGGRLAVARTRQVAGDLIVDASRPRPHHHDPIGEHDRLLDVVGDHD